MNRSLASIGLLAGALLSACGGEEAEPVTLYAQMELFRESESVAYLMAELARRNVPVLRFQCGYEDRERVPFELRSFPVFGRDYRYVLITVHAADEKAVRSIPMRGLDLSPEQVALRLEGNSDPFDCDPMVEATTGRFGG